MTTVTAPMEAAIADVANNYIQRGWAVVPLPPGKKAPKIRAWTTHTFGPGDFAAGCNIGVKLGTPSGGLVDVDLDGAAAYALADQFLPPTGATFGHGDRLESHRLYVCGQPGRTRRWPKAGVELRSTGGQTMFPPSIHPNGEPVKWAGAGVPASVDWADLVAACERLASAAVEVITVSSGDVSTEIERHGDARDTEAPEIMTSISLPLCVSVDSVIKETLPTGKGQRNGYIFRLVRGLKFEAGLAEASFADLKPIVRRWHDLAFSAIGTKSFDETWADFVRGWPKARTPLHAAPPAIAYQKAKAGPLPPQASGYESEPARLLVGLCFYLGTQHPQGRFFLSCHRAGALLDIAPDTALKFLNMFVADGLLERVEAGNAYRATRYRWPALEPRQLE